MFNQSDETLDLMHAKWKTMSGQDREMMSREIFESLSPSDRHRIKRGAIEWGRGFGGGSYVNLLLSIVLDPRSRKGLSGLWRKYKWDE
jgi:hypothetical protein